MYLPSKKNMPPRVVVFQETLKSELSNSAGSEIEPPSDISFVSEAESKREKDSME